MASDLTGHDLTGRTIAVTGGNSGLGFETCRVLAERGASVILMGRNAQACTDAARRIGGATRVIACDLADFDSVRRAAGQIERLDVLINNAGLFVREYAETRGGFERTLATNHLGPYLLTRLLVPKFTDDDPRVVNVSSRAHERSPVPDFDDLNLKHRWHRLRGGWSAYCQSKLLNLWFTRAFARRYPGIQCNALHPGVINTGIFRELPGWLQAPMRWFFLKTPAAGAKTQIALATQQIGLTGGYFVDEKPVQPSLLALNDAAAERLWDWSERALEL